MIMYVKRTDGICTEYIITCECCGKQEHAYTGDANYRYNDTPSKYFRRHGWKTNEIGKTLCSKCAKS